MAARQNYREPTRMKANTESVIHPADVQTSVVTKSTAARISVWVRINSRQEVFHSVARV